MPYTEIEELIAELAKTRGTTPDMVLLEIELLLEGMSYPTDTFKKKPTIDQYFTKMSPTIRKELETVNQIKNKKLKGIFSSQGMTDLQIIKHLLTESQRLITSAGFADFNLAKVITETIHSKTPESIVAKIYEYVRWANLQSLYPIAARLRGASVEQIEAEMIASTNVNWDDNDGSYAGFPNADAFSKVLGAFHLVTEASDAILDTDENIATLILGRGLVQLNFDKLETKYFELTSHNDRSFLSLSSAPRNNDIDAQIQEAFIELREALKKTYRETVAAIDDEDFTKETAIEASETTIEKVLDEATIENIRAAKYIIKQGRA